MASILRGPGIVVTGGQWGDEGKGRIVDALADLCDIVVRFQGGNNAGHSLHIGKLAIALHLIPCGIMREKKICVIGNGVVIDPEVLFQEMATLLQHGIVCSPENLKIAKNAHIIFPYHKFLDAKRENNSFGHIGTTKRGIGPCYEDKVARFGIMAKDLLSESVLTSRLKNLECQRSALGGSFSFDELFLQARSFGKKIAPFLCDTGEFLFDQLRHGRRVLFEGAQGALLDVDHGTYPYVTSSNCVAAQASIGTGIGMNWLQDVLIVSKAYCTRVGEGPFFTEVSSEEQERFRSLGNEFGATTGRPRRCGWLDLPALRYSARINGASGLILTKVDILSGLPAIKVGMSYHCRGQRVASFLDAMQYYSEGSPIEVEYMELEAATAMPETATCIGDLPASIQKLCEIIERGVEIPIRMVSYGRNRGQEFFVTA